MYNGAGRPTLADVTFSDNVAGEGGGMINESGGNSSLTDVTFSGNSAHAGGSMYNTGSSPVVTATIFISNTAEQHGGGMANLFDSNPTLTNVAFSGNQADSGGGMWNESSSNPTLINVTFSGNLASVGGGMYNSESSPTVSNSILWSNTPEQVFNDSGSHPSFTYNDVQGDCPAGSTCTDLMNADPLFVDAAAGDLRLAPGSPAIDAGNNYSVTVTTDLAGGPRFVDIPAALDTGLGTQPLVDMGAYEANFVDAGILKTIYPLEAVPGQLITYTLSFSNGGSLPAAGVLITDAVPSYLTLQGVSYGGVAITDTGHTPPYNWAVQNLSAGQGGVITLTAILTEPLAVGVYTNTATIAAAGDAGAGNDRSEAGIRVLNVAPLAQGESYTTLEDAPLHTAAPGVLANDRDANGDPLTATLNSAPAHGLLALQPDGSFVYTPTLDYNGPDGFSYQAVDRWGALGTPATVSLTITSVNDAPEGTDNPVTALEDASYTFALADFGFSDPNDSPANSFAGVKITTLLGQGALKLDGTPVTAGQFVTVADISASRLVFSPVLNANGAPYTSFIFQVEDDGGTANGGVNLDPTPNTLTINVTAVNDAPVAVPDTYATDEDTPLVVPIPGVLGNDTDVENNALSATLDSNPAHGLLTFLPDGSFVYTPTLNYNGPDSFTYHADDGVLNSEIVTVTLTVRRAYLVFLPVVQRNGEAQSRGESPQLQPEILLSNPIRRYVVAFENLIKVGHPVWISNTLRVVQNLLQGVN